MTDATSARHAVTKRNGKLASVHPAATHHNSAAAPAAGNLTGVRDLSIDEISTKHRNRRLNRNERAPPPPTARRTFHLRKGSYAFDVRQRRLYKAKKRFYHQWWFPRGLGLLFFGSNSWRDPQHVIYDRNAVRSTKYTVLSFLPVNLFEQLMPWRKPANFYFLCIAVLQTIKAISTTQGRPSILVPLIFVLFVTALKDAYEDYNRGVLDNIKNGEIFKVYRKGQWKERRAENILVGDVVRVEENRRIPADLLLAGSGAENGSHAFIDTKDLDGETNLKPKSVPACLYNACNKSWPDPSCLDCDLRCDVPDGRMSEWNADVRVYPPLFSLPQYGSSNGVGLVEEKVQKEAASSGKPLDKALERRLSSAAPLPPGQIHENVNLDSFILADCVLRNTPFIYGIVVYTGDETKIRRNMEAQLRNNRHKETQAYRLTKSFFLWMALLQMTMCIFAAVVYSINHERDQKDAWYLHHEDEAGYTAFLRFWTWFIITKDFLPISLYVSLELVQFWQAVFMAWDNEMAVTVGGKRISARAQTSRLNEELAQVHYVFSDKTGTLTQNSMEFKKFVVLGRQYGTGATAAGAIRRARMVAGPAHRKGDGGRLTGSTARADAANVTVEETLKAFEAEVSRERAVPGYHKHMHVDFNDRERAVAALRGEAMPERVETDGLSTAVDDQLHPLVDAKEHAVKMQQFLLLLALNNSVFPKMPDVSPRGKSSSSVKGRAKRSTSSAVPATAPPGNEEPASDLDDPVSAPHPQLDSSSPDEKALAYFAQYMGVELFQRSRGQIKVRLTPPTCGSGSNEHEKPKFVLYDDICLIDFSSKRKRMTVIVRRVKEDGSPVDDKVIVFCKGADSIMDEYTSGPLKDKYWQYTQERLLSFGGESLRTLVVAAAECDASWWFDKEHGFKHKLDAIMRNQGPTEAHHADSTCSDACRICKVENEIERSAKMDLLGATAIEDKLQDGVAMVLRDLLDGDIKIWVLTGDNVTTAINIGISCNLLDGDMEADGRLFVMDSDAADCGLLERTLSGFRKRLDEMVTFAKARNDLLRPFGIALHGAVWKVLLEHPDLQEQFFVLASRCRSVVACRLEPKEKSDIVGIMMKRTGVTCLAIGDGNNDTPMIKTADIGVGIRGVEGTSAVTASDYAISQFRFLKKLLFVYGRLNNRRIALLINYIFYKTSLMVWVLFFFGLYSHMSGQFLFLDWAYQVHNIFFTGLPIVVFAIFDRDVKYESMMNFPRLYGLTRGPVLYNTRIFGEWIAWGCMHAAICFFVPWYSYDITSPEEEGRSYGIWSVGVVVYTCVVIVTNARLFLYFANWTYLHFLSIVLSLVSFFGLMFLFSASSTPWSLGGADYNGVMFRLVGSGRYWLTVLLTCTIAYLCDMGMHALWHVFLPSANDITLEADRLGKPLFAGRVEVGEGGGGASAEDCGPGPKKGHFAGDAGTNDGIAAVNDIALPRVVGDTDGSGLGSAASGGNEAHGTTAIVNGDGGINSDEGAGAVSSLTKQVSIDDTTDSGGGNGRMGDDGAVLMRIASVGAGNGRKHIAVPAMLADDGNEQQPHAAVGKWMRATSMKYGSGKGYTGFDFGHTRGVRSYANRDILPPVDLPLVID